MANRLSELPSSPTSQLQTLGTISSSLSLMSDSPDSPDSSSSSSLPPSHVTSRENEALRTWMEKLQLYKCHFEYVIPKAEDDLENLDFRYVTFRKNLENSDGGA